MQHSMLAWLVAGTISLFFGSAMANESSSVDPHAAHKKMMSAPTAQVVHASYDIPDISLVDASGKQTRLQELFSNDRPVVVNFIFTTCTTICPVITATTLQLQKHLADDATQPSYVSISIDPDYDSSSVLQKYAKNYGADWTFLTGEPADVMQAIKAFDAYRGNKVNHFALTLMHAANAEQWTRVEGLTSAQALADIWRESTL